MNCSACPIRASGIFLEITMIEYKPSVFRFDQLVEKAKSLPSAPGVYLFYDKHGTILYVGKSKALHNRVLSYFLNRGKHTPKTEKLVQAIADFQTIFTFSESEALILENEKIKLHQPKFNIRLKDDKDYPYVCLSLEEAYPRLSFARRREKKNDKARYFGPYSSSATVRSIVDTANSVFSLPSCKRRFPQEIGKGRPCLYYHMGRCVGVCTGKVSEKEYRERIDDVISFLRHDHKKVISRFTEEMEEASSRLDFEKAALLRDRIRALQSLSEKKQVVRDLHFHADVFGLFQDDLGGCINLICVREGRVVDSTNFHFGADEIASPESFSSVLLDLYQGKEFFPKEILLPEELWSEELQCLPQVLFPREEVRIRIHVPERGEGRKLLQMARDNAEASALHRRAQFERDEEVLVKLASALQLEEVPLRIESIDISNSGTSVVSAGIVALENARFAKKDYKSFLIERALPDDPACMYEAIYRRLKRFREGDESFSPLPQLFLVDGAALQVAAVRRALDEFGLSIPVFGMVKDSFHKTRNLTDGKNDISISFDPQLFQFIYGIQEEVHRYSFSRMDSRRRKSVKRSQLTEIEGIGEKKAALLLKEMKSIKNVRSATQEQLSTVPGISRKDAERIFSHYHKSE